MYQHNVYLVVFKNKEKTLAIHKYYCFMFLADGSLRSQLS